ncbi:hypothetical protein BDZ89DRAFT_1050323 [Hymenopellis radicata]|nr:hypothetical protein BDZ89DRAFT_1050323 [Hymenopellis radicata]
MPSCLNLRSSLGALNRCRDVGIRLFDGSLRLLWNCLVTLDDLNMFDYLALSSARCCNDDGPRSRPSLTFLQDFSPFVDSRPEPWICLDPGLLGSLTDLDFDYGRTFNPWSLRLSIRGRYRRDAANIMKVVVVTLLRYMRNSADIKSSTLEPLRVDRHQVEPSTRTKEACGRNPLVWLRAARSLSDKLLISSEGDLKDSNWQRSDRRGDWRGSRGKLSTRFASSVFGRW